MAAGETPGETPALLEALTPTDGLSCFALNGLMIDKLAW
jgi:hypothetical protein